MSELPIGETGPAGAQGPPGPSIYDLWLDANPGGTWEEFLDELAGMPGEQGVAGIDSTAEGLQGPPGPSVYDLWLEDNPGGTRTEFWEAMRGPQGEPGPPRTPEVRTVNSDVRRIYLQGTTPPDGVQPGDLLLDDNSPRNFSTIIGSWDPVGAGASRWFRSGATVTIIANLRRTGSSLSGSGTSATIGSAPTPVAYRAETIGGMLVGSSGSNIAHRQFPVWADPDDGVIRVMVTNDSGSATNGGILRFVLTYEVGS